MGQTVPVKVLLFNNCVVTPKTNIMTTLTNPLHHWSEHWMAHLGIVRQIT
jgi:hypothetical protein